MTSPFDFVNAFMEGKNLFDQEGTDEKAYVPFLINRALSYNINTLFYADELNYYHRIPPRTQAKYLNSSIKRSPRKYVSWAKPDKTDDVLLVSEYYEMSLPKARQALSVMSDKDIQSIRDQMKKGGQDNGDTG